MKKIFLTLVLMSCVVMAPGQAQALVLVDSGAGTDSGGLSLFSGQYLAGEFTLGQARTLTDIEAFITTNAGTITLALYNDGGNVPDTSSALFTQLFSVPSAVGHDWHGVTGVNVPLSAGTYWAAFEVRAGNTYDGFAPRGAPNPLSGIAHCSANIPNCGYVQTGFQSFQAWGLRIQENVQGGGQNGNVIPEPATMALFGAGMLGAFVRRRRS